MTTNDHLQPAVLATAPQRTRRRRTRAAVLPLVVVAALALLATGCIFDGTWTATPLAPTTPPSHPSTPYEASDVSCVEDIWCMAVGRDAGSIVQVWDGTSWSNHTAPTGDRVEHVECGAPDRCAATVVRLPENPGDYLYFVVWDGTQWIDVPPGQTIDGPAPTEFTCTADGCVFFDIASDDRMIVWDGSTFTDHDFFNPFGEPTGLDCWSIDDCIANNSFATAHWDGSTWTAIGTNTPNDLGVWETSPLTCGSRTSCVASGWTESGDMVFVHFDGTTWTIETSPIDLTWHPTISCAARNACLAVTSGQFPQALGWNGSDWFSATTLPGSLAVRYLAVSCVPLTCLAVGYEPAPTRLPVAARYEYTDD